MSAAGIAPAKQPLSEEPRLVPAERRNARWARHARRVGLYTWAAVLVCVFALLVALAVANTRVVTFDWLIRSTHASLVWILLAAATLGWVLGITTAIVVHHRTRNPAGS